MLKLKLKLTMCGEIREFMSRADRDDIRECDFDARKTNDWLRLCAVNVDEDVKLKPA